MQQDLEKEIQKMGPWFHNLHLGNGIQTAPDHFLGDFPSFKWKEIEPHIPKDLTGWKVLDIGCNAGFYSFELAKRGAKVTGIDLDPHYLHQANWAAGKLGLSQNVNFVNLQVYDLAHTEETFDIIWFMGVFYHLRYPMLALDIISQKVKRLLVFQTLTMPGKSAFNPKDDYNINDREEMLKEEWPKMAFIENKLNNDPTNWWAANESAILAMMRTCGMSLMAKPHDETFVFKPDTELVNVAKEWNKSEYLSATGIEWKNDIKPKVSKK